MRKTILYIFPLFLFLSLFCGCSKRSEPKQSKTQSAEVNRKTDSYAVFASETLWIEIAETPYKRQRGLMFRKSMPENRGMLFVFQKPQQLSFWMKNTYIPLDIAFISADSVILNIRQMQPLNASIHYLSDGEALYAIEANMGWFKKHGITSGQKVKIVKKPGLSLY